MRDHAAIRVHLAKPGDEGEVARFEDAFDFEVLWEETQRFLSDERHLLLATWVIDPPVSFRRSKSSTPTSGASSS